MLLLLLWLRTVAADAATDAVANAVSLVKGNEKLLQAAFAAVTATSSRRNS